MRVVLKYSLAAFCIIGAFVGPAQSQDWLQGRFATSEGICSGAESIVNGGVEFSLSGGFAADESDCEIVSVAPSKARDGVILTGLCIYAGIDTAEVFAVTNAGDEILITPMIPATEWGTGMLSERTTFFRCQ